MRTEIRLAGRGGQGVVLAGAVLGQALFLDGNHVAQTRSYGSSARGGACKSDLVAESETELYSVALSKIDYLVILSNQAMQKFTGRDSVSEKTLLLVDKFVTIADHLKNNKNIRILPITELAEEAGGLIFTNMILLGMFCAISKRVSLESLKKAVNERVPKYKEKNIAALEKGYDYIGNSS